MSTYDILTLKVDPFKGQSSEKKSLGSCANEDVPSGTWAFAAIIFPGLKCRVLALNTLHHRTIKEAVILPRLKDDSSSQMVGCINGT